MDHNFDQICRLCLKEGCLRSIFEQSKLNVSSPVTLEQMINSLVLCPVKDDDGLPSKICSNCINRLSAAYDFKKQCDDSYNYLVQSFKINENIKQESPDDSLINLKFEQVQIVSCEYKLEENVDKSENDYDAFDAKDQFTDDSVDNLTDFIDDSATKKYKSASKAKSKSDKVKETLGLDVNALKNQLGQFQCNQCTRAFTCKRSFIRHLEKHLGIKSFFCNICQKYYAREWVHMQTHLRPRIKRFQCNKCDKKFNQKGTLNVHLHVHNDEKPHICEDCGKSFKRLARLEIHKKIHSGIKEYMCQYCSKEFCMKKNLITHIKYKHTDERQYQCTKCDKRFVTGHCLKIHERRHLGIKKFSCDVCDKAFVSKSGLIMHNKMHTREKPHACRVCYVKFGRTDHRNRHEMTAHGVDFRKSIK